MRTTWSTAIWLDPLVVVSLFVMVGSALAKFASRKWKAWTQFRQLLTDWHGIPARAGVDRVPGVMERLANGEEADRVIRKELSLNGGKTTLKEVVLEMRQDVAELKEAQKGRMS